MSALIAAALAPWWIATTAAWLIASRLLLAARPPQPHPGCWWNPGVWLWFIPVSRGHWDCA